LSKFIKHLHISYKSKIDELQNAVDRKKEEIAELREENSPNFLFVYREHNYVHLYDEFDQVNRALREGNGRVDCRMILCRISKAVAVEKALCVTVAKSKYGKKVLVNDNTLVFLSSLDVDNFETDVRVMFK
jgi:hypothetical protein